MENECDVSLSLGIIAGFIFPLNCPLMIDPTFGNGFFYWRCRPDRHITRRKWFVMNLIIICDIRKMAAIYRESLACLMLACSKFIHVERSLYIDASKKPSPQFKLRWHEDRFFRIFYYQIEHYRQKYRTVIVSYDGVYT